LRHQQEHVINQHGTGVNKENWSEHKNEADMVRYVGLAYRKIDGGRDREIFFPCVINTVVELKPTPCSATTRG